MQGFAVCGGIAGPGLPVGWKLERASQFRTWNFGQWMESDVVKTSEGIVEDILDQSAGRREVRIILKAYTGA